MNLRQMHYFMHIARLGSFSRAAEFLNVAQPALSRHIRELEGEIGTALLLRHGRGAVPTLAGTRLLRHATGILKAFEDAKRDVAALADEPKGVIRLGVPPAVSECLSAELVDTMKSRFSRVSFQITETWSGHIRRLLLEKKLDLGILSLPQVNRSFHYTPIAEEAVYLVSAAKRPRHPETLRLRDLGSIPLVLAPEPHGSRLVIDQALKQAGVKANIVLESEVWSMIKDVVRRGIACTLVPRRDVIDELRNGTLKAEPLQKPGIRHTLVLARMSDRRKTPFENEIFDFLAARLQQARAARGQD
jgi:LysR family nitrogen assimilation transcriptional regulator